MKGLRTNEALRTYKVIIISEWLRCGTELRTNEGLRADEAPRTGLGAKNWRGAIRSAKNW